VQKLTRPKQPGTGTNPSSISARKSGMEKDAIKEGSRKAADVPLRTSETDHCIDHVRSGIGKEKRGEDK